MTLSMPFDRLRYLLYESSNPQDISSDALLVISHIGHNHDRNQDYTLWDEDVLEEGTAFLCDGDGGPEKRSEFESNWIDLEDRLDDMVPSSNYWLYSELVEREWGEYMWDLSRLRELSQGDIDREPWNYDEAKEWEAIYNAIG